MDSLEFALTIRFEINEIRKVLSITKPDLEFSYAYCLEKMYYCSVYECFVIFLHSEDNKSLLWRHKWDHVFKNITF